MPQCRVVPIPAVILGLVLILSIPAAAATKHVLQSMSKDPGQNSTQIRFVLDSIPKYSVTSLGQRLEVGFERTHPADGLRPLTDGGDVVSCFVEPHGSQIVVSIFLRRPPKDVEFMTSGKKTVLVTLKWPEPGRWSRPGISGQPEKKEVIVDQGAAAGFYLSSPYSGRWLDFIQSYETPVDIQIPLRYGLIPRRILAGRRQAEKPEAGNGNASLSGTHGNKDSAATDHPLLAAYDLLHNGRPQAALEIMHGMPGVFRSGSGPDRALKRYIYLRCLAAAGRPYQALAGMGQKTEPSFQNKTVRFYWIMLEAELSLVTGQPKKTLALLKDLSSPGTNTSRRVIARRAQAEYDLKQRKGFRRTLDKGGLDVESLRAFPAVLLRLAADLYAREEYPQAMRCYNVLADVSRTDGQRAKVLWRMGMCLRRSGEPGAAKRVMRRIIRKWPQTGGAYRARMTLNDIKVLESPDHLSPGNVTAYTEVAENAFNRDLREEAAFKQVIVLRQMDQLRRAVHWLSDFLREFATGPLHLHARVLMGEMLPGVVNTLLDQGDYITGLALVAEHRDILVHTDMPHAFLRRVGNAFEDLGLYSRAARVFVYMLARSQDPKRRAFLLSRMVSLSERMGEMVSMQRYAETYVRDFPKGRQRATVTATVARALLDTGRAGSALDWLLDPSRSLSRELDLLTARALYRAGDYERMGRYVHRAEIPGKPLPARVCYQWADGLRRREQYDRALSTYRLLFDDPDYGNRAMYMAAKCLVQAGRFNQGAKLYARLAEKTKSPDWRKLAQYSQFLTQVHDLLPRQ